MEGLQMFKILGKDLNDKIMAILTEDIKEQLKGKEFVIGNDGSYLPNEKLKEVTEKKRLLEESINQLKADLENTKKTSITKESMDELVNKFTEDLKTKDKQFEKFKAETLVIKELEKSGVIFPDLMLGKVNFNDINIEKPDSIKPQIEALKAQYKEMFRETRTSGNTSQDGLPPNTNNTSYEAFNSKKNKSMTDFAMFLGGLKKE
jgi:hypothetical protein